jgi:hypothetical protein
MAKHKEEPARLLTRAEQHAAAIQARMVERVWKSRQAEAAYEATLDPRQFQA